MRARCARNFKGFASDLSTEAKSASRSASSTSIEASNVPSPVYASIILGEGLERGDIGLAAIDLTTTDFHLFTFKDQSSFETQLQELKPEEIIICDSKKEHHLKTALYDVVRSLCPKATFTAVKQSYFDDSQGLSLYHSVHEALKSKAKPECLDYKTLCLAALNALFHFTEYLQASSLPPSSLTVSFHEDPIFIVCPLCEKDENAERHLMASLSEIQHHFFHFHWQVHGYACQFCGTMFSTAEELRTSHSDCSEWEEWNLARLSEEGTETLNMVVCRMFVCCSDCGWHTALSSKGKNINEQGTFNYIKTFFAHHNNDGLLGMIVYFPDHPKDEVKSVHFTVISMAGGNPTDHVNEALVCGDCKAQSTTEYLLEQHQMSHLHDNSYFADYLTNSALIHPPTINRSCSPHYGWKNRAVGGVNNDLRRSDGKKPIDKGYHNERIQEESAMAREVRERLRNKYADCEGMGGFDLLDDSIWLKDEDALKFKEWMDYWESEEGREKGGPPKKIEVDISPMRIPTIEVEVQFVDTDVISGFMLNDNVFYCMECATILKGEQAVEHLKKKGDAENPCSLNEGRIEEHPLKNDNLYLLHSLATSSPSSSIPCPVCTHKLCSITGLRIHMMVDHRVFVNYQRMKDENVTDSISSILDIRSPLLRRKEKMKGPSKKLADSKDKRGRNGRRESKRTTTTMHQSGDMVVKIRKPPPVVVRVVKGYPALYDDSDDDDVVEAPKSAADAAQITLQRPTVTTKRAKPTGADTPDGEADEEVIKYILAKIVQNVVRNEEKDDNVVGGLNEPRFNDDEEVEMMEMEMDGRRSQPVIRSITPDDDELCVVAEVENNGHSTAAATSSNHREKKMSCPKCSSKFITSASLTVHINRDHKFDAGANMITEELGIPLSTPIYLCPLCTLAFPTLHLHKLHIDQHSRNSMQTCDCCSGASSKEIMAHHLKHVGEEKIGYICGECRVEFKHEISLHEHNESKHGVTLFYFCKVCKIGSTDSFRIYQHFMMSCPHGYCVLKTRGILKPSAQDHASKCIGVCPASLLHFQPINLKTHKKDLEEYPERYVVPSLCSHRSMIVALEKKVTCDTCRCLEASSGHAALYQMKTGKRWAEMRMTPALASAPLSQLHLAYEEWKEERNKKKRTNNTECQPSTSQVNPHPEASNVFRRTLLISSQQAQQRLCDRLNAAMQARGGTRSANGGGGGEVDRRGVSAPMSVGTNRIMMNGGRRAINDLPMIHSTTGGNSSNTGGETRGPVVPLFNLPPPSLSPSPSGLPSPTQFPTLHSLLSSLVSSTAKDDNPSTSANPPRDQ